MSGLSRSGRTVIVHAVEHARAEGKQQIGEEHLLLAVLGDAAVRPVLETSQALPDAPTLLAEVQEARRRGGVSAAEAESLAALGIDVDDIVRRIESNLGEGALDDAGRIVSRRRRKLSMSKPARRALVSARRQAADRGHRTVGADDLLLGLLHQRGLAADVLGRRGITTGTARAALSHGS